MRRAAAVFPVHGRPTVRNSVGCLIITPLLGERLIIAFRHASSTAPKRPHSGVIPEHWPTQAARRLTWGSWLHLAGSWLRVSGDASVGLLNAYVLGGAGGDERAR